MHQMNKTTTMEEYAEFHKNVFKLSAEQQSDLLDVVRALAADNMDADTLIPDAIRLENMRRIAKKNGIVILKRFNRSFGESAYMLIDAVNNFVIAGSDPVQYSFSLDNVENWLSTIDVADMDINAQTVPPVPSNAEATAVLTHSTQRRAAQ